MRRGVAGVENINQSLQSVLNPNGVLIPRRAFGVGDKVMQIRNNYELDVYNGDVGVIIRDPDGISHAYFHRSGAFISFPVSMLPDWELAFAMTVHKSQGSEFDHVLLALPDDEAHRLLTREIVYTGIIGDAGEVFHFFIDKR